MTNNKLFKLPHTEFRKLFFQLPEKEQFEIVDSILGDWYKKDSNWFYELRQNSNKDNRNYYPYMYRELPTQFRSGKRRWYRQTLRGMAEVMHSITAQGYEPTKSMKEIKAEKAAQNPKATVKIADMSFEEREEYKRKRQIANFQRKIKNFSMDSWLGDENATGEPEFPVSEEYENFAPNMDNFTFAGWIGD